MKTIIAGAIAAAGLLAVAAIPASAQTRNQTPGAQMQENGSVQGSPGASGYAPGHKMQENGSVKGTTGASGYAPGHATTGAGVNSDTDLKAGKSGVSGSTRGNVNIK